MLVFQAESCLTYQTIECMVEIREKIWCRKVQNSTCCLLRILIHLLVLHLNSLHLNLPAINTRPFPPLGGRHYDDLHRKALRWLTQEIFALNGAIALMLLWPCYHFSWWSISLIHLCQNHLYPATALVIPLSINRYIIISRKNMGQIWPPVYYPCAYTLATMKEWGI